VILFRCSADATTGFGHLARCRALAAALASEGIAVSMAGPNHAARQASDKQLFANWFEMPADRDSKADASMLSGFARKIGSRMLVIDDYRVDETYQGVLRHEGLRWLQFQSPNGQSIWSDLVLHANPAVSSADYAGMLRNSATRLLLGPRYALLRAEFGRAAARRRKGGTARQVMLAFGAGDDRGAIQRTFPPLLTAAPPDMRFVVVSGVHNPNNAALVDWLRTVGDGRVTFLIDPPNLIEIMQASDIAVTSGGTLTYELAACGVAMLILAVSDNQLEAAAWEKQGAAIFLGPMAALMDQRLTDCFAALCRWADARDRMGKRAAQLVDGQGARRVAQILDEAI